MVGTGSYLDDVVATNKYDLGVVTHFFVLDWISEQNVFLSRIWLLSRM